METTYLTVTALTKYIKRKFDGDPYLKKVYVTGEISNFRKRPSHQYFSLKDEQALIGAMMLEWNFKKLKFEPQEGMKVLAVGHIAVYEKTGAYQFYIDQMEPDGVGALALAFEQLKKKLVAEGVFSQPKKAIPRFPKQIAVVTSESGAVIRDIQNTVYRRYPIAQIVLYPAVVQGEHSKRSIMACLNRIEADGQADVVIIGRGGGSIEDLWSFNEEELVRQVAAFPIPIISSVGHETDTTLTDYAADLRAATPTAAAELATPDLVKIYQDLHNLEQRLVSQLQHQLQMNRKQLERLEASTVLQYPQRLYEAYSQRADQFSQTLMLQMQRRLQQERSNYEQLHVKLSKETPMVQIEGFYKEVDYLHQKLLANQEHYLWQTKQRMLKTIQALDLLSPLKSMARGYAIVENSKGMLRSIKETHSGERLAIRLMDGRLQVEVQEIEEEE